MLVCARCRGLLAGSSPLAAISPARCRIRSKSNKPTTVNTDYFVPPTFGRLEVGDQAPILNGYTTNGFVVRNNFVYGSVALLPRTLLNWKVPVQLHQNSSSHANQLCLYSSWAEKQKLNCHCFVGDQGGRYHCWQLYTISSDTTKDRWVSSWL